jgi:hypothetical protein
MLKQGKKHVNRHKGMALALAAIFLFQSCMSKTLIQSYPTGAKVFIDGYMVGITPYTHRDYKIVGMETKLRLDFEGYESFYTSFSRDEKPAVGAIIAGFFFVLPWFWALKYHSARSFELRPRTTSPVWVEEPANFNILNKAEKLRELKKLLDEGVINNFEFEREKRKILEEE